MAFTPVADPLLDSGKPARSTDVKQMRDNQADHESRISALESVPDAFVSSHFTQNHFRDNSAASPNGVLLTTGGTDGTYELNDFPEPFYLGLNAQKGVGDFAACTIINSAGVTADAHYLHIDMQTALVGAGGEWNWGIIQGRPGFVFSTRTPPITFQARLKLSTSANRDFWCGLIPRVRMGQGVTFSAGIRLERNGANWRFVSSTGGVATNGANITPVADNTWFEVEIIFTNDPSNQALTYLDGVAKDTFTTNLPTGDQLYATAMCGMDAGTAAAPDLYLDYIKCWADGPVADAA